VLKLRRPLGLWTFYYASLHLLTYTGLITASISASPPG